jgi:hypothetical protein
VGWAGRMPFPTAGAFLPPMRSSGVCPFAVKRSLRRLRLALRNLASGAVT